MLAIKMHRRTLNNPYSLGFPFAFWNDFNIKLFKKLICIEYYIPDEHDTKIYEYFKDDYGVWYFKEVKKKMKIVMKGTFTTGEKWQEVANNENEFDKTMLSIEKNGACNWPDEILCYGNYVPVYVSRWVAPNSSTTIKTIKGE